MDLESIAFVLIATAVVVLACGMILINVWSNTAKRITQEMAMRVRQMHDAEQAIRRHLDKAAILGFRNILDK